MGARREPMMELCLETTYDPQGPMGVFIENTTAAPKTQLTESEAYDLASEMANEVEGPNSINYDRLHDHFMDLIVDRFDVVPD
jgi:hypothetical protein